MKSQTTLLGTFVLAGILAACGGGGAASPSAAASSAAAKPSAAASAPASVAAKPASAAASAATSPKPAASGAAAASGSAAAKPAPSLVPATTTVVLKVMTNATLGKILSDDKDKTLYTFDEATTPAAKDPTKCTGACLGAWPPLLSADVPTAPAGVTGKFALITRADANNVKQVTLNDLPLYYFIQDTQPGDAKGQGSKGFGGNWQVVKVS